jgi:predicted MPP superfamily phosphohydrolase
MDIRSSTNGDIWAANRARMEAGNEKHTPDKQWHTRHWGLFKFCLVAFKWTLGLTGLYQRGVRNALDIELNEVELQFDNLPPDFDGYRILQISDPHLDALAELGPTIANLIKQADVDLCALTGDYRFRVHGSFDKVRDAFATIFAEIRARDGIYAILGNHDSVQMVPMFEALGARVLANQTLSLSRNQSSLHITGVDDAYYYFTDDATAALTRAPEGFRIALVHSPELVHLASEANIDFYLTGHTHGGQVCLPGGYPIVTHSMADKRFASGHWTLDRMKGYTSRGAGVSGLPVRFNCRGEVTIFTLRTTRPESRHAA